MNTFFSWMTRGLLIGIIAVAALAFLERDRLIRLLAVNSLFSEDKIVANFTAMDTMFENTPVAASGPVNALTSAASMDTPAGFATLAQDRAVTGIMVLKDGMIRHDSYPLTAGDETDPAASRRISWSVAKSFLSVLIGVLVDDGTIPDLDAPVTQYAPSLVGSAYDEASIRDVLQMSSGVTFDEDYLDFWSDINKMGRVLALGQSMDGFTEDLAGTFTDPGAPRQYVSIDTHVIGMVIRGATGRSIPDLLSEKVSHRWGPRPRRTTLRMGTGWPLCWVV